jgi:hypothetical protein
MMFAALGLTALSIMIPSAIIGGVAYSFLYENYPPIEGVEHV